MLCGDLVEQSGAISWPGDFVPGSSTGVCVGVSGIASATATTQSQRLWFNVNVRNWRDFANIVLSMSLA